MREKADSSYTMRAMLRDLERAGSRGIDRSNTNKTLHALETRGFVTFEVLPTMFGNFKWKITQAGKDHLK